MATAAEPAWQAICTDKLQKSVTGGRDGAKQWEFFRASIDPNDPTKRIIIADAVFDRMSLQGYDLSRCYIVRTSFLDSNLSNANFRLAIFRSSHADNANIEGAAFRGADMTGDGITLNTDRFSRETDFEVEQERLPDVLSRGLRAAASQARHARRWRNRKSYSLTVRMMMALTGHGYSLRWLAGIGMLIVGLFAVAFGIGGQGALDAILASTGYFLGLNAAFNDGILHALGLVEGLLGMLFFAVLTAILVSMFFD